jgi:hypothetical protein
MVVISQYGSGEGSGRVTSRPTLQSEFHLRHMLASCLLRASLDIPHTVKSN